MGKPAGTLFERMLALLSAWRLAHSVPPWDSFCQKRISLGLTVFSPAESGATSEQQQMLSLALKSTC